MSKHGDFDGDGRSEIPVNSPWGIGILKLSGGTLCRSPMMQPNGTRFGGWLLNTADNRFEFIADLDGDGNDEIFIDSPWGIGVLKESGGTMSAVMMAPERHPLRRLAAQHRRQPLRPGRRLRRRRQARDPGDQPVGHRHLQADRQYLHGADDGAERHALRRLAAQHRRQPVRSGRRLRRRRARRDPGRRARGASGS